MDVHNSYHSGVNRARLIAANGNADNQVIVTVASTGTLGGDTSSRTSPLAIVSRQLFDLMDQWLANIAGDDEPGALAKKIARNKPAGARRFLLRRFAAEGHERRAVRTDVSVLHGSPTRCGCACDRRRVQVRAEARGRRRLQPAAYFGAACNGEQRLPEWRLRFREAPDRQGAAGRYMALVPGPRNIHVDPVAGIRTLPRASS